MFLNHLSIIIRTPWRSFPWAPLNKSLICYTLSLDMKASFAEEEMSSMALSPPSFFIPFRSPSYIFRKILFY